MSDHELPTVTTKDAVCHIDFEFQMPYHEPLTSKELLQECIASATTEVLSTIRNQGQTLTLDMDNIDIPEIDLRPNEQTPKRIKVGGWITCHDKQRKIYMDALELAHQSRKISKQIISRTSIKRTKIQIQQFTTRFSNTHHVNKSFVDITEKNKNQYEIFKKRSASLMSNASNEEEKKTNDNSNDNNNASPSPPGTALFEDNTTMIVHPQPGDPINNNNNNNTDGEEEYEMLSKQSTNGTNENDSSFQMVDDLHDADEDQSSNEEQKSLHSDVDDVVALEDYASVTPIISAAVSIDVDADDDDELHKLKLEVQQLKEQHAEELDNFQNKISLLKKERVIDRQRSRISMQIDDEIIKKQFQQQTDDKLMELEMEMAVKQKEQSLSLQQLQLRHAKEMQKFDYKLRQTQELHTLEVSNIRSQHKYQTEQLQSQVRGLTGALERESQKDRKIFALSEENEQLKFDKDKIINNYDAVIDNLNNDSEASIKQEINRRIKENAAFKREINDIKQKMQRENNIKNRLETQLKQLQNEIESKDSVISQMRDMFLKEKKKASILERKLMKNKTKRNVLNDSRNKEILNSGGHVRKSSKTMKNVIIEMEKNAETGDVMITLEKTEDPINILANMKDLELPSDESDDDYDDKEDDNGEVMDAEQHNQEIALKEQQIQTLKSKISNLESLILTIKEEKNQELQALQQKIGSLQQQIEIADETFLKQNGMLEFKLNKKANNNKKLFDDLQDLKRSHQMEKHSLLDQIEKQKLEILDNGRSVQNLEQHLDMMQQENARLKENDEIIADYEEEMEEIDKHYQDLLDDMKKQNDDTEIQFKDLVQQREEENADLKTTVHRQSMSIQELQSLLKHMKSAEVEMEGKEKRIKEIMAEKKRRSPPEQKVETVEEIAVESTDSNSRGRGSVELSENDLSIDEWRGQAQVDAPQPDLPSPQPQVHSDDSEAMEMGGIDMDNYILREEMDEMLLDREQEWNEQSKMQHALQIDTVESKYKRKYENMEEKLNGDLTVLREKNEGLESELNGNRSDIQRLETQLNNVEDDKIQLLHSFMSEMDRMRDEIRKLNARKRSER